MTGRRGGRGLLRVCGGVMRSPSVLALPVWITSPPPPTTNTSHPPSVLALPVRIMSGRCAGPPPAARALRAASSSASRAASSARHLALSSAIWIKRWSMGPALEAGSSMGEEREGGSWVQARPQRKGPPLPLCSPLPSLPLLPPPPNTHPHTPTCHTAGKWNTPPGEAAPRRARRAARPRARAPSARGGRGGACVSPSAARAQRQSRRGRRRGRPMGGWVGAWGVCRGGWGAGGQPTGRQAGRQVGVAARCWPP